MRRAVVLYGEPDGGGAARPTGEWRVRRDLAERAPRLIDVFDALFDETLPAPCA